MSPERSCRYGVGASMSKCLRFAVGVVDRDRREDVRVSLIEPDVLLDRHGLLAAVGPERDCGDAVPGDAVAETRCGVRAVLHQDTACHCDRLGLCERVAAGVD